MLSLTKNYIHLYYITTTWFPKEIPQDQILKRKKSNFYLPKSSPQVASTAAASAVPTRHQVKGCPCKAHFAVGSPQTRTQPTQGIQLKNIWHYQKICQHFFDLPICSGKIPVWWCISDNNRYTTRISHSKSFTSKNAFWFLKKTTCPTVDGSEIPHQLIVTVVHPCILHLCFVHPWFSRQNPSCPQKYRSRSQVQPLEVSRMGNGGSLAGAGSCRVSGNCRLVDLALNQAAKPWWNTHI